MRLKNVIFLRKANAKGSSGKIAVTVLMIITIISMSVISCYTKTIDKVSNEAKQNFRARALAIYPFGGKMFTDNVIEKIKNIKHVEDVFEWKSSYNFIFDIYNVSEENTILENWEKSETATFIWPMIGTEKISVIDGKPLDKSPAFSCIVPSKFYPFGDDYVKRNDEIIDRDERGYINGSDLIGKTLTIGTEEGRETSYNFSLDGKEAHSQYITLPSQKFKLKVVGVYDCKPSAEGDYSNIFFSEETGRKIMEKELKAANIDLERNDNLISEWWNTPALHGHTILVDNYENLSYVYNMVSEIDVNCDNEPMIDILEEEEKSILDILKTIGIIFIPSVSVMCFILYLHYAVNFLSKRNCEVGVLKALGYKSKQVFLCYSYEISHIAFTGILFGSVIAAAFVGLSNYRNTHSAMANMLYLVDWNDFLGLLGIALAFSITVPVICQLIVLKKLTKIQPREAIAAE